MPKKISRVAFAAGEVGDGVAYQTFSFLIFTFYFTVVKLPLNYITTGFIIWSIWNSFNDPLIGFLSDKTKHKKGRRIIWMTVSVIPLALVLILLFTPPLNSPNNLKVAYFMILLFVFDTIYTAWNLNYNASFSEMFLSVKDRSEVGKIRGMFVILSVIIAFVLPSFLIEDMTNQYDYDYTPTQYLVVVIIAAVVMLISFTIVITKGLMQREEFDEDAAKSPSINDAMKHTFSNKAFVIFLIPALGTWICIGILPTVIPLYATYVLGIADENSILIGVLLLAAFLVAALTMPLWEKLRYKKGARFTGIVGCLVWGVCQLLFMNSPTFGIAITVFAFAGAGLGGSLYFYDQCLAEIIDEDEVKYGVRRAGAYYGIISFVIRLSGIINFLVIGAVFQGSEWEQNYSPNPDLDVLAALKFLVGWFPAIILLISAIGLYFYPIKGKRLDNTRDELDELHKQKKQKRNEKTEEIEDSTKD
jgi:glycoside/pentoside/hexuronide:cation symporter, GPH family